MRHSFERIKGIRTYGHLGRFQINCSSNNSSSKSSTIESSNNSSSNNNNNNNNNSSSSSNSNSSSNSSSSNSSNSNSISNNNNNSSINNNSTSSTSNSSTSSSTNLLSKWRYKQVKAEAPNRNRHHNSNQGLRLRWLEGKIRRPSAMLSNMLRCSSSTPHNRRSNHQLYSNLNSSPSNSPILHPSSRRSSNLRPSNNRLSSLKLSSITKLNNKHKHKRRYIKPNNRLRLQ